MFGAVEAGGTKFVCAVGTGPEDLRTTRIATTTPDETLGAVVDFFRREGGGQVSAIGVGSFGPVELHRGARHYGYITNTPKPGWQYVNVAGTLSDALRCPVAFETDVNAAVLGESKWGAARGAGSCLYLTVGTGIGGGAISDGRLMHGRTHPEMGHIRIPHDLTLDPWPGSCPFHGDCLEGLASGSAMAARWGVRPESLPDDHPAWAFEARYLALAIANFAYTFSPERVILGGGVMLHAALLQMIRAEVESIVGGYVELPEILPPGLGGRSGVLGALALAIEGMPSER